MALNFLGLGFSFGAKDAGLKTKQRQVAAGFSDIGGEVEKMGRKAAGGAKPLTEMTNKLSGSSMDKLTASINNLSEMVGKTLPKSSKKGADAMHRGADDMESDERKIGGGFHFIRDAIEKLNSILRQNRLQTFIQAVSLARLNDIAHGVSDIATNGLNLTTSLEGTIVAANKTSRAMGANFGLAGKHLARFERQATAMGIALNIGTEKAADATYQVTQASKELSAVGLKSAADLAKFSEVSGVSAAETTQIFKQAGKQFHLTDKQLRQLAGSMLKSGEVFGDVGGQLKMMPHVMELISRRAAVMGKKLSPQQMADFASQTLAVSAAFYDMGVSADDARAMATAMADKMVESGEQFSNLFAGTATDISDFHVALGIATGDINKSFKTMTEGPAEFMSGLAEMVLQSKKSGKFTSNSMNLLRGQLEKAFGPKQSAMMINFFNQATDAQLATMKATSKATGDLGKFANAGFSTGRTLAESFDLAKNSFIMNFRSIGRKDAVEFVNDTSKQFDIFTKKLQGIAAQGGPLGLIVTKFSEMHQIGAMALLPKTLRPMAAVFGTIIKEGTPLIGMLGSLGLRLSSLLNPLTLVTVGIGGMMYLMRSTEKDALAHDKALNKSKKTLAALEHQQARLIKQGHRSLKLDQKIAKQKALMGAMEKQVIARAKEQSKKQIGDFVRSVVQRVSALVTAIPRVVGEAFQTLKDIWPQIGPPLLSALNRAWNWLKKTALPAIVDFVSALWDGLIYGNDKTAKTSAAKLGASIGEALRQAFDYAVGFIKEYLGKWWKKMTGIWSDGSSSLLDKVKATFSNSLGLILGIFALNKFVPVFSILGTLGRVIGVTGKAFFKMADVIVRTVGPALVKFVRTLVVDVLPTVLKTAYAIAEQLVAALWSFATEVLPAAIAALAEFGIAAAKAAAEVLTSMLPALASMVVSFVAEAAAAVAAWIATLGPIALIVAGVAGLGLAILALVGKFKTVVHAVGSFFGAIGGFFESVGSHVANLFRHSNTVVVDQARVTQQQIEQLQKTVQDGIASVQAAIDKGQTDVARSVSGTMADVQQRGNTAFISVKNSAELALLSTKKMSDKVAGAVNSNVVLIDTQMRKVSKNFSLWSKELKVNDLISQYSDLRKEYNEILKSEDAEGNLDADKAKRLSEIQDLQEKLAAQAYQLTGLNINGIEAETNALAKQFGVKADLYTKGNQLAETYYQNRLTDIANQMEARKKEIRDQIKDQEAGLAAQLAAHQITQQQFKAMTAALEKEQSQQLTDAQNYAQHVKGVLETGLADAQKGWSNAIKEQTTDQERILALATGAGQTLFDQTTSQLKGLDSKIVESAANEAKAQSEYLSARAQAILSDTKLTEEQRAQQADALYKQMDALQKDLIQRAKTASQQMAFDADSAMKSFDDSSTKAMSQLQDHMTETMTKTQAAAGTVQKELGMTAEQAANHLEALAQINPKEFAKSLDIIKATYVSFAKTARDESQKMLDVTNKAFNEFNKDAIDFWTKQKTNISLMEFNQDDIKKLSETVGKTVQRAFTLLTDVISQKVQEAVTQGFIKAFAKVIVDAKKFVKDAMSVFRDLAFQMVKQFGDAWAQILDFTASAIAAIEKDTARAVANLQRIDMAMRGSATMQTQTAGAEVHQDVQMDTGKSELGNIFQATHHPEWYEQDFKYKAMQIIDALNSLAAALQQMPRGGQVAASPAASSRAAAGIRSAARGGPGGNRARMGASGGQI